MPTTAPAVVAGSDKSPAKAGWTARLGLAVVVAVLISCFGVLIAASRGAAVETPSDSAAAPVSAVDAAR